MFATGTSTSEVEGSAVVESPPTSCKQGELCNNGVAEVWLHEVAQHVGSEVCGAILGRNCCLECWGWEGWESQHPLVDWGVAQLAKRSSWYEGE